MRTYLQSLKLYPQSIQEALIQEAPHTRFPVAPKGLEFLTKGIVDLGFENLGLDEREFKRIMLGFSSLGVIIPNSGGLKIRADGMFQAVVEQNGRQRGLPILPDNWKDAIIVIDPGTNEIIHAGVLVRKDQLLGLKSS